MTECWKDVKGYEGTYQISNTGRVKSLKKWDVSKRKYIDKETILTPTDNGYGYLVVSLRKKTKRKSHYVHRLVAEAFVSNPKGMPYVNHVDYDKRNNNHSNLEWCNQKDNVLHSAERMKHPKTITHSNTGEKYISKRKDRFRITIAKKEYGTCSSIEEAVMKRDKIIKELKYV